MKKKLIGLTVFLIILISLTCILFTIKYKKPFEEMIVQESSFIYYNEKNLKSNKEFLELFGEVEELKKVSETYKKVFTYLDRFFVLGLSTYGINYNSLEKQDLLLVMDFGNKYPFLWFKLHKYFDKQDGIYVLNKKYKEKMIKKKILKEENDIYLMAYRGYYVLSLNKDVFSKYKKELIKEKTNEKFTKNLNRKNMYMLDFEKALGHDTLVGENNFDYLLGYLDFNQDKVLSENLVKLKEDKLAKYITPSENKMIDYYIKDEKGLYISNSALSDIIYMLFVFNFKMQDMPATFDTLNWSALTDRIGTEAYIDIKEKNAAISLKDSEFFRFFAKLLLQQDEDGGYIINKDNKIYIEDDILFLNKKMDKGEEHKSKPEDLLKLKVTMKDIFEMLKVENTYSDDCSVDVIGKNIDGQLRIRIEIDSCAVKNIMRNKEALMKQEYGGKDDKDL